MISKIATLVVLFQITTWTRGKPTLSEVTMPSQCSDKTYCFDRSDDYPQALINSVVMKENMIRVENEIQAREEMIYKDACNSSSTFKPIYHIVDENGLMRYVVQTDDSTPKQFKQTIWVEECAKKGEVTSDTSSVSLTSVLKQHVPDLSEGFKLYCKQIYIDYSFLVLSIDGTKTEAVKARDGIPFFCMCVVDEPICHD